MYKSYRLRIIGGITLSSIYCKIFDDVILLRYADKFCIRESQFGFNRKRSTTMCTMLKHELIAIIGLVFFGTFAQADAIVLLPRTAMVMRLMLGIYDHYALEYSILFNANKSKCISVGS